MSPTCFLHGLDAAAAQPEGDVLVDVEVREERVALEDGVHRALVRGQGGDVLVAEVDRAGGGVLQAGDHAQGGGLAAARGAEEREEGALGHGEVERLDGGEGAVGLADPGEADVVAALVWWVAVSVMGTVPGESERKRLRTGACAGVRGQAPVSLENFSSNAVSSLAVRERKEWDLAAIASSGMISGLSAAALSIFASWAAP